MERYRFDFTSGILSLANRSRDRYGILITDGYRCTDFISVRPGSSVTIAGSDLNPIGVCYNSQQVSVSEITSSTFTVPTGVYYIRVNLKMSSIDDGTAKVVVDGGANLVEQVRTHAIWNDDFSIDTELETGQQFYRTKINGKLTFLGDDYKYIMGKAFDAKMFVALYQFVNGEWKWQFDAKFMRTDCTIDEDNKIITVQPEVQDQYNKVLAGMEKEFDLLKVSPITYPITLYKRPMIQVYRPGDSVVSNYVGGMWWEQNAENPTTDKKKITDTYHFALNKTMANIQATAQGGASSAINGVYSGETGSTLDKVYTFGNGTSKYKVTYERYLDNGYYGALKVMDGNTVIYMYEWYTGLLNAGTYTLVGQSGNPGTVKLDVSMDEFYTRYLTDTKTVNGTEASDIPADDIVENNKNYRYVIKYAVECIYISTMFSDKTGEYGEYKGKYYLPPYAIWNPEFFPVARSYWADASYWFTAPLLDEYFERDWRKEYVLNDAYSLSSCIKKLLGEIDEDVTHESFEFYSKFFYSTSNPISGEKFSVYLTQKSNLINGVYQTPASKAVTTLKQFTDMLRDCFNCYWYIEDAMFKIEHIKYFENGMSYSNIPVTWKDLTKELDVKTAKPWAYRTSNYTFDKETMPVRYEYEWMDDCTEPFQGLPMEVISNYVTEDKIEKINIGNFTSDVDYMLLNPGNISQDGFVLFCTQTVNGKLVLPFVKITQNGYEKTLQNGFAAFGYLQPNFLSYNVPASTLRINGSIDYARSISKKKKQTITFPLHPDDSINPIQDIKTYLGYGNIEKISLNLSSQMIKATLKYPTT